VLNSPEPAGRAVEVNLALLRTVATRIGTLSEKVMFLGGTIVPLLVSGPAAAEVRIAKDVDFMIHAPTKAALWEIEDELWDVGMKKTSTGSTCHWRLDDIHIDVLTTDPDSVDLINQWGREATLNARRLDIGGGLLVNVVRSTHYIATKFDAFHRRGRGSYRTSLDISDIRLVLRGCPDLERDVRHTSPELRAHLVAELGRLLSGIERGAEDVQDVREGLTSIQDPAMDQDLPAILKA
jgi:hypothetical protein